MMEGENMMKELICIVCPKGCHLKVDENNDYSVTGNSCPRGAEYGRNELLHPVRVLTGTVKAEGSDSRRCSVKTATAIPKEKLLEAAKELDRIVAHAPVKIGDVIAEDIAGCGVALLATMNIPEN